MAEAERWRFPPESDLVGTWRFNEADHPVVGLVEEGSDTDG